MTTKFIRQKEAFEKALQDRKEEILNLRDNKKLSWGQIGILVGLTRQRAWKIYQDAKNGGQE